MKNIYQVSSYDQYLDLLEEIRNSIRYKRSDGLTEKQLAYELGITPEHLCRLLQNQYPLKAEYLVYLILRLGLKDLL